MDKLRVAVIGVGHLGRHHARILSTIEGVSLVAVSDSRIEQAQAVGIPLGVEAVADYRDLFGRVDAVSIAVPTVLHREVAGAFLEQGISTMVEKPLAASLREAEELVSLAKTTGATLQVGHIERFNPAFTTLDAAKLRPKFISAERLGVYTFRSTDVGVVLDLMIHDLDLVLSLNPSEVESVEAVGVSIFGIHEDVANARIRFRDGCVADLTASRASQSAARKMRIWASEGYATLDFGTKSATFVRPSEPLREGIVDVSGVDLSKPAEVKEHLFGKLLRVDQVQSENQDQLTLELQDFVRSVRSGHSPRVPGVDGLRAIRVAHEILKSLRSHAWEGTSDGPVGPHDVPERHAEPNSGLPEPKLWRYRGSRVVGSTDDKSENTR